MRFLFAARAGRPWLVCVALVLTAANLSWGEAAGTETVPRDHLYGVAFIGDGQGWACGAYGSVFHTEDGGIRWTAQRSGTTEPLFDVDFVDARRGWIVGRVGTVLWTTDGGRTWREADSGSRRHLFGVDFADAQHGWAVGDWGMIVHTGDGGQTWVERPLGKDVILNDVVFVDRHHGWIVGEMGTVLRTEDGGETWERVDPGVPKTLFGVHFTDRRNGWAVGIDALILRTRDGGETWEVQNGDPELGALEQVGFRAAFDRPGLYAVQVAGRFGFAVGDLGAVWRTEDGGETWQRAPTSYRDGASWLRAVAIVPGTHGLIVGAGGSHLRISDGRLVPVGQP